MKKLPASVVWFLLLLLTALLLQGIAMLFELIPSDASVVLYFAHLYAIIPLCALLLPAYAGYRGVHPMAACFPIGGALFFSPVYSAMAIALICLLLSLLGAVAGQEAQKRRKKGTRHGKRS